MNPRNGQSSSIDSSGEKQLIKPTVADVMTRKVITLRPQDNLVDAFNRISNHRIHHLLIVDLDGRLIGVVSDRDILWALPNVASWHTKRMSEIMTPNPVTVTAETPIVAAVAKLITKRINCLPVLSGDGSICGIVTSTDLLKAYHALLKSLNKIPTSPHRL